MKKLLIPVLALLLLLPTGTALAKGGGKEDVPQSGDTPQSGESLIEVPWSAEFYLENTYINEPPIPEELLPETIPAEIIMSVRGDKKPFENPPLIRESFDLVRISGNFYSAFGTSYFPDPDLNPPNCVLNPELCDPLTGLAYGSINGSTLDAVVVYYPPLTLGDWKNVDGGEPLPGEETETVEFGPWWEADTPIHHSAPDWVGYPPTGWTYNFLFEGKAFYLLTTPVIPPDPEPPVVPEPPDPEPPVEPPTPQPPTPEPPQSVDPPEPPKPELPEPAEPQKAENIPKQELAKTGSNLELLGFAGGLLLLGGMALIPRLRH